MFERAIQKARDALGGGSLVRLQLQQPERGDKPSQVITTGGGIPGWYTPDVWDRWLFRAGSAPDQDQILRFIQLGDTGEVRFLFGVYEEMYSRDAHIRAEVGKRESYVLSARRDVLPMPANYRKAGLEETAEAKLSHECSDYVESQIFAPGVDFDGAFAWLLSADLFGIAVLEVITEGGTGPEGRERLVSLRRVPPQRLRVVQNGTRWEVRSEENEWIPLDLLRELGAAIVLEYEPNLVSPVRRGLFRSILPLWLMRTQGPLWWGRAVEIFGMPMRVATQTSGGTSKTDLALEFQDQGAGAAFSLPPGTDIKVLDAVRGELPHERFLEWAAKEISKVIHHSTQHSDIQRGAGSTASAESQVDVMIVAAQGAANRAALAITEQLFGGLIKRNFGEDIARIYTPEYRVRIAGTKSMDEMLKGAQAVDTLQKAGVEIPASWAYDFFTIPTPDEDEKILEPVAPAPANVFPFPARASGDGGAEPKQLQASRTGDRREAGAAKHQLSDLEDKAARDAWNAGHQLLAPYISLFDQAAKEKWPLPQLLSRVLHRFYGQTGASSATLRDTLAAAMAEAELRGLADVRKSRGTSAG